MAIERSADTLWLKAEEGDIDAWRKLEELVYSRRNKGDAKRLIVAARLNRVRWTSMRLSMEKFLGELEEMEEETQDE